MESNKLTPGGRWLELKQEIGTIPNYEIIIEIDKIDKDTPWQDCEPKWWLEMMDKRKELRDNLIS